MTATLHPTPTTCPLSGAPAMQLPTIGHKREIVSSSLGRYAVSSTVDAMLEHQPWDDRERELLAGRIAERHRCGEACPVITSYFLEDVLGASRRRLRSRP